MSRPSMYAFAASLDRSRSPLAGDRGLFSPNSHRAQRALGFVRRSSSLRETDPLTTPALRCYSIRENGTLLAARQSFAAKAAPT